MPLSGRIFLILLVIAVAFGMLLDNPRPMAVRPAGHLGVLTDSGATTPTHS